jgi:hypothetical protein
VVGLNEILTDYRKLLLGVLEGRFDLGLDEYKRGFPTVIASAPSVTSSSETTTARQVRDAFATVDKSFARRRIQG